MLGLLTIETEKLSNEEFKMNDKKYTIASEDYFVNLRSQPSLDSRVLFIVSPGNVFFGREIEGSPDWLGLRDVETDTFMGYALASLFREV